MTHTSTEPPEALRNEPVAYLWQHTITGEKKALMRDDVFTAGQNWRLVGPLHLATESTVNQGMTVQTPPLPHTAKRKLDDLLTQGFRINGYAIERDDGEWSPQRGFITHGGSVGWWQPHQLDDINAADMAQVFD